jgi:hypothetical protein
MDHTRLTVHEGHEQEVALIAAKNGKRPCRNGLLRQNQRHCILGKGLRRTSMNIPRELVQHDDLGQASMGPDTPLVKLSRRRLLQ